MSTPPAKGQVFSFETALVSQAVPDTFQANPTLAAGDVTLFGDGTALGNIATLPTAIGGGCVVTVALTAAEMNYDRIAVLFHDQAGNEWQDRLERLFTSPYSFSSSIMAIIQALLSTSPINKALRQEDDPLFLYRGDTWTQTITGLGDMTGYDDIWFGIKADKDDTDTQATVLISADNGLEIINGATAANPANGNIAVVGAATGGTITVTLEAEETAKLTASKRYHWDAQKDIGGTITTPKCGTVLVSADIVRTTA